MSEKIRVTVLMGGSSNEREVSLMSGTRVAESLDKEKYEVNTLDFTGSISKLNATLKKTDIVFIALHGTGGEDGKIQGLLDLLEVPYTGSGALSSAMAMHKGVSRIMYKNAGIPIAKGMEISAYSDISTLDAMTESIIAEIGIPCVVKPANEGSSVGVSIVTDANKLDEALSEAFLYDVDIIVEKFIKGIEISVPVLGTADPKALPAVEITPKSGFYDYENKYTAGKTEEICPARLTDAQTARAAELAIKAHNALRCINVSRTDMIVAEDDIYVIETNTIPGMTELSLLPLSAKAVGISFAELLDIMIMDTIGHDESEENEY